MKTTTQTKRTKPEPMTVQVVNLADMGERPEWATVCAVFAGLGAWQRRVLMHWLAQHLGMARQHEDLALCDPRQRDYSSGAASEVRSLIAEMELMRQGRVDAPELAGLAQWFGKRKE